MFRHTHDHPLWDHESYHVQVIMQMTIFMCHIPIFCSIVILAYCGTDRFLLDPKTQDSTNPNFAVWQSIRKPNERNPLSGHMKPTKC